MFEVGDKVAVFNSNGVYTRDDEVRKVYKGGNVVLKGFKGSLGQIVGDKDQYRPSGDTAHRTGDHWMKDFIRVYNAETKSIIEAAQAKKKLRITQGRLLKLIDGGVFTQDQLDRVIKILVEG